MSKKVAKRMGSMIYVDPSKVEEYKTLHANVWPDILKRLEKSNIRNYTIYFCDKLNILFSHMEYIGNDLDEDMKSIADDPKTRDWWKVCEPCQKPLVWDGKPPSEGGHGNWWYPLEEVFHDGLPATSYKE